MRIGWTNLDYNVERSVLNKVSGIEYVRSRSYASMVHRALSYLRLRPAGCLKFGRSYIGGTANGRVDLFHFFNLLGGGLCKRPFVTTFETCVPRGLDPDDYWFRRGIDNLMSGRCRKLLALSGCAKRIQLDSLGAILSTSDLAVIEDKIEVLHPPQDMLFERTDDKSRSPAGGLKAVFVGRDFFRKGGGEIVRAFVRVRKDYPVELWVIGDLTRYDYACDRAVDDAAVYLRMIEENKDWIHWYSSMPNAKVLELMKTCDIGLLPTRADTYGYSVLEMQACGLPVITTDVRALPEINDDDCGWVIRGCGVRDGTGRYGEADYSTPEKLADLSRRIENGIYDKVMEASSNLEQVTCKGELARKRILNEHNPAQYARNLLRIYEAALS